MLKTTTDGSFASFNSLNPSSIAALFDVDGTLIDIGPSPFEVDVPASLIQSLEKLSALTGGAVALVSGRPIRDLDKLFYPLELPAIGGHGAETRLGGSEITHVDDLPKPLRSRLMEAATPGSGIQVEDKGYSVALHYRKAPKEAERLRHHAAACRAAFPDTPTELLLGKAIIEVKQRGIEKGAAVRDLMTRKPFAGRMPVFAGDDVTDESVFKMLPALGGMGFGVGRHFEHISGIFGTPAELRAALQELAARAPAPV